MIYSKRDSSQNLEQAPQQPHRVLLALKRTLKLGFNISISLCVGLGIGLTIFSKVPFH